MRCSDSKIPCLRGLLEGLEGNATLRNSRSGCSWFDGVDSDGGWAEVAGAAGLVAFLDAVAVVADAFECPWAGALAALGDGSAADLSQNLGYGVVPVLRGESRAPALFTGLLSDQRQDSVWVSADPPAGGADVGGSVQAVETDGDDTERGHDLWAVTGTDLAVVLGEGHVPYPVQPVLDGPVPTDRVGQLGCGGVVVGQVGDCVDGFAADPAAGKRSAGAGDLDRQRGMGEGDPGGDLDELHGPGLDSAVALVGGGVNGVDLSPGHGPKLAEIPAGIAFPHAALAIQIIRTRRPFARSRVSRETVYAVTDLTHDGTTAAELADAIRGHWCIENRLHWIRDVTFAEDHSQVRTGHGPQVMATFRNLAVSLHRLHQGS